MARIRRGKGLDALDYAILQALREDARRPNHAISQRLGVSHVTVRDRVERLIGDGYIRILPVAAPRAFGYEREVDMLLNMEPLSALHLAESMQHDPAVRRVALVTGGFDVFVNAVFRNEQELLAFLRRVAASPGVRAMHTLHVVQIYKQEHEWQVTPADDEVRHPDDDRQRSLAIDGDTLDPAFLDKLQVAGRWLAALLDANVDELLAHSTDDVVFEVLPPTLLAGRYTGKEELALHAQHIAQQFPIRSARIVRARPGGSTHEIILHWSAMAVHEDGIVRHGEHLLRVLMRGGLVQQAIDRRRDAREPPPDGDTWTAPDELTPAPRRGD